MPWKPTNFGVDIVTTFDVPVSRVRDIVFVHKQNDYMPKINAIKDLRNWFTGAYGSTLSLTDAKQMIEEVYENWEKYNG